jgi:hypothetical protein
MDKVAYFIIFLQVDTPAKAACGDAIKISTVELHYAPALRATPFASTH